MTLRNFLPRLKSWWAKLPAYIKYYRGRYWRFADLLWAEVNHRLSLCGRTAFRGYREIITSTNVLTLVGENGVGEKILGKVALDQHAFVRLTLNYQALELLAGKLAVLTPKPIGKFIVEPYGVVFVESYLVGSNGYEIAYREKAQCEELLGAAGRMLRVIQGSQQGQDMQQVMQNEGDSSASLIICFEQWTPQGGYSLYLSEIQEEEDVAINVGEDDETVQRSEEVLGEYQNLIRELFCCYERNIAEDNRDDGKLTDADYKCAPGMCFREEVTHGLERVFAMLFDLWQEIELPVGFSHGDYWLGNVLFSAGESDEGEDWEVVGVIDWDRSSYGVPLLYDRLHLHIFDSAVWNGHSIGEEVVSALGEEIFPVREVLLFWVIFIANTLKASPQLFCRRRWVKRNILNVLNYTLRSLSNDDAD